MFRKLVTNVPFSPALVGQLGFYARRLKREEATRRLGLVFTALALIVQSFAVFTPPQSANAANASDFIPGGINDKATLLRLYDQNKYSLKDIFNYAGVTRSELAGLKAGSINSKGHGTGNTAWQTWGRTHRFSASQGEVKHVVPRTGGESVTVYSKPLWLYDSLDYTIKHGSTYPAFVGHSAKLGTIAIMKGCGNLVSTKTPKPAPQGAFLAANCNEIRGYAYDARNRNRDVKVYLYFGGAPGKGDKSPAIKASLSGNKFKYDVPAKYQKSSKPTKVWGVLVPLAGWNDSTVQFKNTVSIPGNCVKPQATPTAICSDLKINRISRTEVSLVGQARVNNGAKINSYTFVVTDKSGKVVATKKVNSHQNSVDSGKISLASAGDYKSKLTLATSVGNKSGSDCVKTFSISTLDKCEFDASINANDERCKACKGNPEIWAEDQDCKPETVQSKSAKNLTQEADAETVTSKAGDRIEYTINVQNTGVVMAKADMTEELTDVSEYATLADNGGGKYDSAKHQLKWDDVNLKPGEKQSRTFVVQVLDKIPNMPQGQSEPGSYDCVMTNAFGNTVSVKVNCNAPKAVEQTVKQLPHTGASENMIFAASLLAVVVYFWSRSRQLGQEVKLIRKDLNAGVI